MPGVDALFTTADAVGGSEGNHWVLAVEGLTQGSRNVETLKGELGARRVPVTVGNEEVKIASFSLVTIDGGGSLKEGDLLVPGPTEAHETGFYVDDNSWQLRPGDLVKVDMTHGALPRGLYVPVSAIRERNGATHVFRVGEDNIARQVSVEVAESVGELRRIVTKESLAGSRIVDTGIHFLRDGDEVLVTGKVR